MENRQNRRTIETDLILYINANGSDEFRFVAELEVRYAIYFKGKSVLKPDEDNVLEIGHSMSRRFRIAVRVVNPFDITLDYQILNPVVRHANYDNNTMRRMFVAGEKSLVSVTLENKRIEVLT